MDLYILMYALYKVGLFIAICFLAVVLVAATKPRSSDRRKSVNHKWDS